MKIAIGSDHGGFELKEKLKSYLESKGYDVIDEGCFSLERVDYPVYCGLVCKAVQKKEADWGILVCTTGIGMSICANKYKGIRAALVHNNDMARLTREHNDSNVLCLSQKYTLIDEAEEFVDTFLNTEFTFGRHLNRVKMIEEAENER